MRQEEALSEQKKLETGVPQGSILGPIIYLLYIADMPELEKQHLSYVCWWQGNNGSWKQPWWSIALGLYRKNIMNFITYLIANWNCYIHKENTGQNMHSAYSDLWLLETLYLDVRSIRSDIKIRSNLLYPTANGTLVQAK